MLLTYTYVHQHYNALRPSNRFSSYQYEQTGWVVFSDITSLCYFMLASHRGYYSVCQKNIIRKNTITQ